MDNDHPLNSQDYDPMALATGVQLLSLLRRLGLSGSEIARRIRVPFSSVSMWTHGARAVPQKYLPLLRTQAQLALEEAAELNDKARSVAPTEEIRLAIQAELGSLWARWKSEVLYEAGTLRRGLQRNYETLGHWLQQDPPTRESVEAAQVVMDTIQQQLQLLLTLAQSPNTIQSNTKGSGV